jgi:hypothetical protein
MAKPNPPKLSRTPSEHELRAYARRLQEYEQALLRWERSLSQREEEFAEDLAEEMGFEDEEEIEWVWCSDCGGYHPERIMDVEDVRTALVQAGKANTKTDAPESEISWLNELYSLQDERPDKHTQTPVGNTRIPRGQV